MDDYVGAQKKVKVGDPMTILNSICNRERARSAEVRCP